MNAPKIYTPEDLPTPVDYPDADIVIYDGKCVFCLGQVRRLKRYDSDNRLAFMSLHDPAVGERFPELTFEQLMQQMYVIDNRTEQPFGGAAAVRYLTTRLPKLWWAKPLVHLIPLPLLQWGYNYVANRRYEIANKNGEAECEGGTCSLHFSDTKKAEREK